jgi:phytanoyl-CoA hydroxylase
MTSFSVDPESIASFQANGFVAFRNFVAGDELAGLIEKLEHFVQRTAPGLPPEAVFYDDKNDPGSLKQIQQMGDHDRWFDQLFRGGRIRQVAQALVGGPVDPKNMQYFNKPPGTSKPTPPHQDGYYFMLDPCNAVTMWLALDSVDQENGCVRYVRGSHLRPMRSHSRTETLGFSQGIAEYPTNEDQAHEVAMPAEPGDLLVHHAMTVHWADQNRSLNRSRRSLGFIYYDRRAKQDMLAHEKYQRQLAIEMKAAGKI